MTKSDEYPPQLLAKKLLLVTEYQPVVTCADFIKVQLTTGKSFKCNQIKIGTYSFFKENFP